VSAVTLSPKAMTHTRPIWAEIARSRLLHNYRLLQRLAGPDADLLTVIKADAYGHGLADCARTLAAGGSRLFGVTSVEEAVTLRGILDSEGYADGRIVAMSGAWQGEAEAVLSHRITPVVWDVAHLESLAAAAAGDHLAPGAVPVHLEIDTGMSRQGAQPRSFASLVEHLSPESPLRVEAVMTHFHSPENSTATREQMRQFTAAVEALATQGICPQILSAGSSGDLLAQSTTELNDLARRCGARRMVRTGIALYGYPPSGAEQHGLQPVLAWKTRIISLRGIESGTTAGYGATFHAQRPTRLALLAVGYADGLNRTLSNRGAALVRGQRAPIAGRISMDQTMVDVTDIPAAEVGDEVVLIGEQGSERITAADLAQATGTIAYEVLCAIGARVPRRLVD
jgi:alanine racemase